MAPASAVPSQFVHPHCHVEKEKSITSNVYKTNIDSCQSTPRSAVNTIGRSTFASNLANMLPQAIDHMIADAKKASDLAKITSGTSQQRLYDKKHRLISLALELDPSSLIIDSIDIGTGLIGLTSCNKRRMHAPAFLLSRKARSALLQQIENIIDPS